MTPPITTHDISRPPRLLLLETSGRVGQVAIAAGAGLLARRALDETRRHARDLVPTITSLCSEAGWRVRELDGVIVNLGPGSYTGLRVGIMTAKTLAWATGCTALGVESFAAIVRQAPPEAQTIDVLADAQQGNVYMQRWTRTKSEWGRTPLAIISAQAWRAHLTPGIWVTGPGLAGHEGAVPPENPRVERARRDPDPASLLEIAMGRWQRGERDDPLQLEPLYLRPSNAEENWVRLGR